MFLSNKNHTFLKNFLEKNIKNYHMIENDIPQIMKYIEMKNKKMPLKNKNIIFITFIREIIKKKIKKTLDFDGYKIESSKEVFSKLKEALADDFLDKLSEKEEEIKNRNGGNIGDFTEFLTAQTVKDTRLDFNDNHFSNKDLLIDIPEELREIMEEMEKRKLFNEYTFAIDSRSRNHDLYEANKYTLDLNNRYRNIMSIKLQYINLPNSDYIINDSNNSFIVQETDGEDILIELTKGNYNKASLLTEIQTQLNNTASSTYTIQNSTYSIISDYTDGPDSRIISNPSGGWAVFDNSPDTHWESNGITNQLIYELDNSHILTKYSIFVSADPGKGRPTNWTIEISNDKNNWITIDTRVGEVYAYYQKKEYVIANTIPGKYIRINITNTSNTVDMALTEVNFYKTDTTKIDFISDLTGGSGIFNLIFPSNTSLKEILGFSKLLYSGYNIYTTEGLFNLNLFNQYVYMYLNNFNQIEGSENNTKRFYAMIPMLSNKNQYVTYNREANEDAIYYPDFKTEISQLNIEFRRYDGSLVNFNGMEHDYILIIQTINLNNMDE